MKVVISGSFAISLMTLVLVFQNCGKVQFYSANATLVPKVEDEDVNIIGNRDEEIPPSNPEGPGDQPKQNNPPRNSHPQGDQIFICILDGPGSSVRLGVESELLIRNGRTPATVCMSEHACLEIVSQKFAVKAAKFAGYCPNKNPHVVPMTDSELQFMVNGL